MSLWWQASLEWGWLPVVTKLFGNEPLRPLTAQLVYLGIHIHPPILGGFCFEPHMVGSLSEVYSYWKWPIYSWFSHQKLWFSIVMLVYQRCIYIYRLVLVSFYESFVKKTAVRLYQLHSSRDLTIILPYPAEAAHCIHFNTQVFLEFIVGRLHTVAGQVEDTMESWWNWLDNRTVRYSFCNIKTDQNIISGRKLSRTWNIQWGSWNSIPIGSAEALQYPAPQPHGKSYGKQVKFRLSHGDWKQQEWESQEQWLQWANIGNVHNFWGV